jgi:hypothetical protein
LHNQSELPVSIFKYNPDLAQTIRTSRFDFQI